MNQEEAILDRMLRKERIRQGLKGLSYSNKRVLAGVIRQGRSKTELGARLGINVKNVCARLGRISKSVRKLND